MPSLDDHPVLAMPASDTLQTLAAEILTLAAAKGASQAAVNVSQGNRRTLRVRNGDIDTLTQNQSRFLSVTVYFGQRSGSVSSTLFSQEALRETVDAACTLAKYADDDPCSGLPDAQYFAREIEDLELYHPQTLTVEQALALAQRAEQAANTTHEHGRSESTEITSHQGDFILANSAGFCAGYPTSLHSLWSQAIARNATQRQLGFWHSVSRAPDQLAQPETIGQTAAQRAVAQLGARKLSTRRCPVLFDAPVAHSLIHHLVGALSGTALYRSSSFLGLCRGETIVAPHLSLYENPLLRGALASACFDAEGVAAVPRHVIRDGVAQGYFLSSYSGRRLELPPTGHANGPYNLIVSSRDSRPDDDAATLLRTMQNGLLVTTLLGHGLNPMTGDYSQGVAGFWVENGEIQYPVEEITIAGNLKTLLLHCVALGADVHTQGNLSCGSLLIEEMQIAGQ